MMSETVQVGSQNQPNAPPPRVTQQTSWNSPGYPQPQQYESSNRTPEENTGEEPGFFEQASSAVNSGATYVVNGVEKFLSPDKTQSYSLNELLAKGNNVTSAEKSILESQGYVLTPNYERQVIGHESYEAHAARTGVSASFLRSWAAKWGKDPTAIYGDVLTGYTWVKGAGESSLNSVKATAWGVLQGSYEAQDSYEAGYNFGKNTLKPTLQNYGLYEPAKAAVYDLYNKSPLKYEPESDTTIFGTGLTWDEDINRAASDLLPDRWTPDQKIVDYGQSGKPGSQLLKGLTDAYGNWYNKKVAVAPVNVLTEIGAEVAIGAAMGAAIKGGTIVLRTGAEAGASVLGTGAEAVGGNIAGKALSLGAKGLSYGSRIVEPATNVILTGQVIEDVASSKSYEEGWGKVAGLAVGGIGFKYGAEGAVKAYDVARTRGMSEIPISEIVDAKVLSGNTQLPMIEKGTSANEVVTMFKNSKGGSSGYHATPAEFKANSKAFDDVTRKTDMPGLYISPEQSGPSVHFTRVSGSGGNPYLSLAEGIKETASGVIHLNPGETKAGISKAVTSVVGGSTPTKPAIIHVELSKGVERLPEDIRYNVPKDKTVNGEIVFENSPSRQYYRDSTNTGKTFLTPVLERSLKSGGSAEAEAVITPNTPLTRIGTEGYITFNGRRIPVISYTTKEAGIKGTGIKEVSRGLDASKDLQTGHAEFRGKTNDIINTESAEPLFRPGQVEAAAGAKQLRKSEAWASKQKQDVIEVKAKDLKNSYSYEPVNNRGILSGIGYTPSPGYGDSMSLSSLGAGESMVSVYAPTVKNPSELHARTERNTGVVSPELSTLIRDLDYYSGSDAYSGHVPGSSILPRSITDNSSPSSIVSGLKVSTAGPVTPSRVSTERIISGLTPSSQGPSTLSRISPERIISGMAPSNPVPVRPSRISPERIISGMIPSNLNPDRPGRSNPDNIIPGYIPYNPEPREPGRETPDRRIIGHIPYNPEPNRSDSGRTISHVTIGTDYIFRSDRFGKGSLKDEYKPKKFVTPGISGTMKKGYLRNQFGSLEGFAKKVSGDKVGFKKIKIR